MSSAVLRHILSSPMLRAPRRGRAFVNRAALRLGLPASIPRAGSAVSLRDGFLTGLRGSAPRARKASKHYPPHPHASPLARGPSCGALRAGLGVQRSEPPCTCYPRSRRVPGVMRGASLRKPLFKESIMTNRKNASPAVPENGTVLFIPLNKLKKSPRNARKTPHAKADIEALAASITPRRGQLSPVLVSWSVSSIPSPTPSPPRPFSFVTWHRRAACRIRVKAVIALSIPSTAIRYRP